MGKATTAPRISKSRRLLWPVEIFYPKSSITSSAVFHAELVSSPNSILQIVKEIGDHQFEQLSQDCTQGTSRPVKG